MRSTIRISLMGRRLQGSFVRAGVTEDVTIMNATDTITLIEGYDAMRIFLDTVWLRLGKTGEEIDFIVAGLKWTDGAPVDPAMWQDWLAAVQITSSGRSGETEPPTGRYSVRNPSGSAFAKAWRWAFPNCRRSLVSVKPSLVMP